MRSVEVEVEEVAVCESDRLTESHRRDRLQLCAVYSYSYISFSCTYDETMDTIEPIT